MHLPGRKKKEARTKSWGEKLQEGRQSQGGWQAVFSRHERNLLSFLRTLDTPKVCAKDRHLSVTEWGGTHEKSQMFPVLEN